MSPSWGLVSSESGQRDTAVPLKPVIDSGRQSVSASHQGKALKGLRVGATSGTMNFYLF
jgi:hypothetical protein